ncbi:MAG: hypothetical protein PHT07_12800 [Paludibacter sp.]|nr:hypothetical protein [Paludibacter sp.]
MKQMVLKTPKVLVNRINFSVLIPILIFLLISCKPVPCGFNLQKFEISNHKLDSIINKFTAEYGKNCSIEKRKIIVLDLRFIDSIPQFWFSFHEKDELRDFFIFYQNRRIIGYLTKNKSELIVLSDVNSKNKFEKLFSNFIYPTKKSKIFDYIFFPDNQFKNDSVELKINGVIVKEYSWPEVTSMHDYPHIPFKYINNDFINEK